MYFIRSIKFFIAGWREHLRKRKENILALKLFSKMQPELALNATENVSQMKQDLKQLKMLIHRLELQKSIEKTIEFEEKNP